MSNADDRAVADDSRDLAAGDVDREQRMLADVLGGGVDASCRPADSVMPSAERSHCGSISRVAPVARSIAISAEAVGFEARALHRAVVQRLAVAR